MDIALPLTYIFATLMLKLDVVAKLDDKEVNA